MKLNFNQMDVKKLESILDTVDCVSNELFTDSSDQQGVTLIHFASYTGTLEILNHAHALGVDLYNTDCMGRCGLHYAASEGQVEVVRWFIERTTDRAKLSLQDIFGRTPLHAAVNQKNIEVMELLVEADVDVNVRDKKRLTPLHLTWKNVDRNSPMEILLYEKMVDTLLSSRRLRKFVDEPIEVSFATDEAVGTARKTTVLNCAVILNSPETTRKLLEDGLIVARPYQTQAMTTSLHIAAQHGFHQTLSVLLQYRYLMSWMINMKNEVGQTPLHVAVSEGHLKCAHTLANSGGSLLSEADNGLSVIEALFRYNERPTTFLTELLDAGVNLTEGNANTVTLDFKVLTPVGRLQMAVVSALISTVPSMKQMNILQHPLVEAFLGLKWRRLSSSFVVLLIFQVIFVASLYMYGSALLENESDHPLKRRVLSACALFMLLHFIVQLIMIPKYYVKHCETWLSFICATICVIVTATEEFRHYDSQKNDAPPFWVLQLVSIVILFACIQMMLLIGRFPPWGRYALMFFTVLMNVLKVFLAVIWIIVGFSLSFAILFHKCDQFANPWKAFMKTMLMMMGEYEYSDIFETVDSSNPAARNDTSLSKNHGYNLLPITSRLVFLTFIIFTSIVLMNFMIGLAVIDIQGLLNEGLILRLMKQAEFVTHLEQVTSHWIFRSRFSPGSLRKMLEAINTIPTQISLESSTRQEKHPCGIPKKLMDKLFDLASKNENFRERSERARSHSEDDDHLAASISYFQEGLRKLQQQKNATMRHAVSEM